MKNLKVSSLFHWLYGAVMFLPILLLPVFMIYSHRHTIDSGTLEVPQQKIIDFNQIVKNGNFDGVGNWVLTNCSYQNNGIINDTGETYFGASQTCSLEVNDNYIIRVNCLTNMQTITLFNTNVWVNESVSIDNNYYFSGVANGTLQDFFIGRVSGGQLDDYIKFISINVFDTTQMFGAGNEPTIQEFNQYFTDVFYDYTLSRKELLEVGTITYSDTDIMSQATYQLYNVTRTMFLSKLCGWTRTSFVLHYITDKYFNISQFFGFENLWDYMLLNWFGGNVTIYLRIFWQLLTYWLVVSIAWLIFDLFMYVPKLAHRWLDRSAIE